MTVRTAASKPSQAPPRRPASSPTPPRPLWITAVWTGVGAAVVCALLAIVIVAICWLPVSGPTGHSSSALRAGLLTFLASLHGGLTIDGTPTQFIPLGMLAVVLFTAWRAGDVLADAAGVAKVTEPKPLAQAAGVQAASFAATALLMVPFAQLGTSDAPVLGIAVAALLCCAIPGGLALGLGTELRASSAARLPQLAKRATRLAVTAVLVQLVAATVLVAGSLVWHHSEVTALSRQTGGGWGGVPVLLLGILSAPNAVIAAAGYLAGPGFAVGSSITAWSTPHGVVPAFPLLGALPHGHGATWPVFVLMGLTGLAVCAALTRAMRGVATWRARLLEVAAGAGLGGLVLSVLAWQGGGAVGDGRLRTVGVSPWQFGLFGAAEVVVCGSVAVLVVGWLRRREDKPAKPTDKPTSKAEAIAESTAASVAALVELSKAKVGSKLRAS